MARITLHNARFTEYLNKAEPDNVVILTDDDDPELKGRTDTFYVVEMSLKTIGELIKRFPKDTVVFDAHMGTGIIGVICKDLGYDYIGCEEDKDLYDLAKKRIYE